MGNCVRLLVPNKGTLEEIKTLVADCPEVKHWGNNAINVGSESPFGVLPQHKDWFVINAVNHTDNVENVLKSQGLLENALWQDLDDYSLSKYFRL